jgi:osmoprotectant transport system ATP-binding protein
VYSSTDEVSKSDADDHRTFFGPATTVHEALEALTGTAGPAAPFTVAQLMAAFGEALQREEDAWKR